MKRKIRSFCAGLVLLSFLFIPYLAHGAMTPGAKLVYTSPNTKISGTTWTADSGTALTLSESGMYSNSESALAFNATQAATNYASGTIGSTSGLSYVTLEIKAKFPNSQWTGNTSYGMVFAWATNNQSIWIQGTNIGFNTGGGDIYGFKLDTPTDYRNSYHTYTFVLTNTATATNQKIYVDGVKQSLSLLQGTTNARNFDASGNFTFGRYGNSANFYGFYYLREARIYARELSQAEVTDNYNSQLAPTSISLGLTNGLTSAVYRTQSTIRATVDVDGKVTFYQMGKRIPGCINIQSSGYADCRWSPSVKGANKITAQVSANGGNLTSSTFAVQVSARSGQR